MLSVCWEISLGFWWIGDWWNHFGLIRFLDANQGLCDVYRSALQRCGGWNPADAWDLCGFLTIHNHQFWSLGRAMNEYEWPARVCLGSLYSSVAWLIDHRKVTVESCSTCRVRSCPMPPMSPLVRQFGPNSEHMMRVLDRPCWGSCWTGVWNRSERSLWKQRSGGQNSGYVV